MKLQSIAKNGKSAIASSIRNNRYGGEKKIKGFVPEYLKVNRKSPKFDEYLQDKDKIWKTAKMAELFVKEALTKEVIHHSIEGSGKLLRRTVKKDKLGLEKLLLSQTFMMKKKNNHRNNTSSSLLISNDIKDIAEWKPNTSISPKSISYLVERSLKSKNVNSLELYNQLSRHAIKKDIGFFLSGIRACIKQKNGERALQIAETAKVTLGGTKEENENKFI